LEKFGFVYLWFDRKTKRFYIGSHWGTEDDGYVSSNPKVQEAYRERPQDFKRRILSRMTANRLDLYAEEKRWLDMIKGEEFGVRYYNINKTVHGHGTVSGYKKYECRCPACKKANSKYQREYRQFMKKQKAQQTTVLVARKNPPYNFPSRLHQMMAMRERLKHQQRTVLEGLSWKVVAHYYSQHLKPINERELQQ
jgi:hypothetical protein